MPYCLVVVYCFFSSPKNLDTSKIAVVADPDILTKWPYIEVCLQKMQTNEMANSSEGKTDCAESDQTTSIK